jgi:hypothetical protein
LVFFLSSFGFRVRKLEVGGEVFFFNCIWCGQWIVDTGLSMQVLLGGEGEDLFSFQPIGGPKVPYFYSF